MITIVAYLADSYEVRWFRNGVSSIIKYPRSMDCRGELVDYDDLPEVLQRKIYEKLKHELKFMDYDDSDSNDNSNDN